MSKYNSKKVVIDGITFDSKKEGQRYLVLREKESKQEIKNLKLQQRYKLIPTQKDEVNNETLRGITYVADFVYEKDGKIIVEDVKASKRYKTDVYKIKRKLLLFTQGIAIKEIYNAIND